MDTPIDCKKLSDFCRRIHKNSQLFQINMQEAECCLFLPFCKRNQDSAFQKKGLATNYRSSPYGFSAEVADNY
jgi:hypothetical protein